MTIARIKAALTADHRSRAAYSGRYVQKTEVIVPDADGNPIHATIDVVITWDIIKKILNSVIKRAGLTEESPNETDLH